MTDQHKAQASDRFVVVGDAVYIGSDHDFLDYAAGRDHAIAHNLELVSSTLTTQQLLGVGSNRWQDRIRSDIEAEKSKRRAK